MGLCGDSCKGYYFSTHYAAAGAQGATKEFIDAYKAKYGKTPDDVAALTWDSANLMIKAIQNAGSLSGFLKADRAAVMGALGKVKEFPRHHRRHDLHPRRRPHQVRRGREDRRRRAVQLPQVRLPVSLIDSTRWRPAPAGRLA